MWRIIPSHVFWKIKNVWNHQPVCIYIYIIKHMGYVGASTWVCLNIGQAIPLVNHHFHYGKPFHWWIIIFTMNIGTGIPQWAMCLPIRTRSLTPRGEASAPRGVRFPEHMSFLRTWRTWAFHQWRYPNSWMIYAPVNYIYLYNIAKPWAIYGWFTKNGGFP